MTITKTLVLDEGKHEWSLNLVIGKGRGKATERLATFSKRPMALCAMAGAVNSFKQWLGVEHLILSATPEGIDALKSVGIYDPETCDVGGVS